MNLSQILENTVYFLALINPPSKILLLSTKEPRCSSQELFSISLRSNIAAFIILIILTSLGNFILTTIFHVQIYSLSVAGGIIIFLIGLKAVEKGRFFYEDTSGKVSDISIIPLAAPLTAGPGVITAAIAASSLHSVPSVLICLAVALFVNFILMLFSNHIGRGMEKFQLTGPLIRITGLIVTAVAVQMIFSGCTTWLQQVFPSIAK